MTTTELIDQVKANLLITFDDDDQLIGALINAATSYACSFQHLPENHYETHEMLSLIHIYNGSTLGLIPRVDRWEYLPQSQ